jgi:hypothetical protein
MTLDEKFLNVVGELEAQRDGLTQQLADVTTRLNKLQRLQTRVKTLPIDEQEALLAILSRTT